MSSLTSLHKKGKQEKRLGIAKNIRREYLKTTELDAHLKMIHELTLLGLAETYAFLDEEVHQWTSEL